MSRILMLLRGTVQDVPPELFSCADFQQYLSAEGIAQAPPYSSIFVRHDGVFMMHAYRGSRRYVNAVIFQNMFSFWSAALPTAAVDARLNTKVRVILTV